MDLEQNVVVTNLLKEIQKTGGVWTWGGLACRVCVCPLKLLLCVLCLKVYYSYTTLLICPEA